MLSCQLQGGLGNQLFQIFHLISLALHYKTNWYIVPTKSIGKRPSYWTTMFSNLRPWFRPSYVFPTNPCSEQQLEVMTQQVRTLMITSTNTVLTGYFQDYRLFDTHFKEICGILNLDSLRKYASTIYTLPYDTTTSMHFRYGDYKTLATHYNILEYSYYRAALYHIMYTQYTTSRITHVLVFYELPDYADVVAIVDRLKIDPVFKPITFTFVDTAIPDWAQMMMMSNCKNNIIANSTFSWWGAYLNQHPDKMVCFPSVWYRSGLSHVSTEGLRPDGWHCIISNK